MRRLGADVVQAGKLIVKLPGHTGVSGELVSALWVGLVAAD